MSRATVPAPYTRVVTYEFGLGGVPMELGCMWRASWRGEYWLIEAVGWDCSVTVRSGEFGLDWDVRIPHGTRAEHHTSLLAEKLLNALTKLWTANPPPVPSWAGHAPSRRTARCAASLQRLAIRHRRISLAPGLRSTAQAGASSACAAQCEKNASQR